MKYILMDYVNERGWPKLTNAEKDHWLGAYLAYIEEKQLLEDYPAAQGRPVLIHIAFNESPSDLGKEFLSYAREQVLAQGYDLKYYVLEE